MQRHLFLGLVVFLVACSDDGSTPATSTNDGGTANDAATTTGSSANCPSGTVRAVWSDAQRPARDVCMTTSSIAHGDAKASTLITIREGTQAAPTSWLVVQVDGDTETKVGLVAYYISPSSPETTYSRTCSPTPCGEIEVGPSSVYETGRAISLRGLVLPVASGSGNVTLTGTLDAR